MRKKGSQSKHKSVKGKKPPPVGHKHQGRITAHSESRIIREEAKEPKPWVNHFALNKGL